MSPVLSINQVVAYNLKRARMAKGWSQSEAGGSLQPLGLAWSKQTFSVAERAFSGDAERDFSVNELVAFTRAFGFPLAYFLTPPPWCREVTTAAPSWMIYFDDYPDTPARWRGANPYKSNRAPIARVIGPEWDFAWDARELLGAIGSADTTAIAARLRSLADEIEVQG